jgi:nucleotide-binding universal stress UspA family protein
MKLLLTCLDSSPRAPRVLDAALDLARRTGAKLRLFRSVGLPPELGQDIAGLSSQEIVETLLANAQRDIEALAKEVPPELLDGASTHIGTAWDAICREARRVDCDLVVIGSHGYGGLDRLLGTTAAKVVNHADRSVLVVR